MSEQPTDPRVWPENFLQMCDYRARCYVNGTRRNERTGQIEPNSGHWSATFQVHPWVDQSELEGWARELRMHVIMVCKRRLLNGRDMGAPEELMPDKKWVEYEQEQAHRAKLAKEWRDRMEAQYGTMDAYYSHAAKNHRPTGAKRSAGAAVRRVLTEVSRRMQGGDE